MKGILLLPEYGASPDPLLRGWLPPLGLLSIAGYCNSRHQEQVVRVTQSADLGELVFATTDAQVIGISLNYRNFGQLPDLISAIGLTEKRFVLGGPLASSYGKRLISVLGLSDHGIDVVIGPGEIPFLNLLTEDGEWASKGIPNREIVGAQIAPQEMSLDYTSIEMDKLVETSRTVVGPDWNAGTGIVSQIGCYWKASRGGCSFCAIPNKDLTLRPVESVSGEVANLNSKYGIDFFFDVSEDAMSHTSYLKDLLAAGWPAGIGFRHYCSARRATQERISLLRQLGTTQVFVGFESDDDEVLRKMNKASTSAVNRKCIDNLVDVGVPFIGGFIFGAKGETSASIKRTLAFIDHLADTGLCDDIHASAFKVLPGAPAFDDLSEEFSLRWDWQAAQERWISSMCEIGVKDIELALRYAQSISENLPRRYRRL